MVHCLPRRSAAQTGAEPILRAMPTGNTGNTKNTGVSTRKRVGHVQWKFQSTWRSGLLAGRVHCTEPILWAREYGLIRTYTDWYGLWTHGAVRAMCCRISGTHGCQRAKALSVFVRIRLYQSVLHCPHHVFCVKCPAGKKNPVSGFVRMRDFGRCATAYRYFGSISPWALMRSLHMAMMSSMLNSEAVWGSSMAA